MPAEIINLNLQNNENTYENPLPGTVVDKYITRSDMYDFFLVSQSVRQGTVSPTHFIVLRDDANYGPDIIQKLSYKLCYLYYNWPGTVRVPACCMVSFTLLVSPNCKYITQKLEIKLN